MKVLVFAALFVVACSSPDGSNNDPIRPSDAETRDDVGSIADEGFRPGDSGNDGTRSDQGGDPPDSEPGADGGANNETDDAGSSLPTACVNDCLCESSCSHRCNIQCKAECASGTCDFEFNAGAEVTCRSGSTCNISCESGACEVNCEPGATCELRCGPQTVACFFTNCGGDQNDCGARTKTCGKPC